MWIAIAIALRGSSILNADFDFWRDPLLALDFSPLDCSLSLSEFQAQTMAV
jgi:hypothetical protein